MHGKGEAPAAFEMGEVVTSGVEQCMCSLTPSGQPIIFGPGSTPFTNLVLENGKGAR